MVIWSITTIMARDDGVRVFKGWITNSYFVSGVGFNIVNVRTTNTTARI